jgi:pimeloyl-ACP methyl ester carboxylesterase
MKILSLCLIALLLTVSFAARAECESSGIGIVVMHGKGGSPARHVAELASGLEANGVCVANLDMPWSARRSYDSDVRTAEKEVEAALDTLRSKGAKTLFVSGHSQGGLFALHFGNAHHVAGIIAIAPGGNVGNAMFAEKLGDSVTRARQLVAEGKGNGKTQLFDFESSKGLIPVVTTPAIFLDWFDPAGAMNQTEAVVHMAADVPVLYVAPTNDYPALIKVNPAMFAALPRNPFSKFYQPNATHIGSPAASLDEILRWTREVASRAGPQSAQ